MKDRCTETEGAASTQPDRKQEIASTRVQPKRRRGTKIPAAVTTAADTTDSRQLSEDSAAALTDALDDAVPAGGFDVGAVDADRSRRSVRTLGDEVLYYLLEDLKDEREELLLAYGQATAKATVPAMETAGAQLKEWNGEAGGVLSIDSARATFLASTSLPSDDTSPTLDPKLLGLSHQHHHHHHVGAPSHTASPPLPFADADQALTGWMGSIKHQHEDESGSFRDREHPPHPPYHHRQRLDLQHAHRFHRGINCGEDSSQYEEFLRIVSGIDGERGEPLSQRLAGTRRENDLQHDDNDSEMTRQAMLMGQHPGGAIDHHTGLNLSAIHDDDVNARRCFSPPAPVGQHSESLDILTLWVKLDGFSPGDLPSHGLAPEVHRWLQHRSTGAISGHIQPGCTLLTVDCLMPLADTSNIRTEGVHALAESLLAGPLVRLDGCALVL